MESFKETSEKYRQEMMKMYGNSSRKETEAQEVIQDDTEIPENNEADDINEKFPPPVIPDFIKNPVENENTEYGYLKVSVKTGNGGLPIENAVVTVSEVTDGKENVLKILKTNESGSIETIQLPAPKNSFGSQPKDYENYSKYNVSVYYEGFFREASVNVPIFADITSIQTFYLIPQPLEFNSGERTIIDRNPEPEI